MRDRKFATVDCETDPFEYGKELKPFIWGFYDGKKYKYFFSTEKFVEHIKKFDGIIYAHNGGKFDYHFLLSFLNTPQEVMIINGRLAKAKLGKCELRDSYILLPVPLKKMQKDDIDYNKMKVGVRHEHMTEIIKYLEGDCVYLWNYIADFGSVYGSNLTLAGAAIKFWQNMGNNTPRSDKKFYSFFKPYYYGGRVEAFRKGEIKTHIDFVDINSAYPYVMRKYMHPISTSFFETSRVPDNQLRNAFLKITAKSGGGLPFATYNSSGQRLTLSFPDQKNTYCITGHEFISALKTRTLSDIKIETAYIFTHSINFSDYVDHFFGLKKKAKKGSSEYLFAKLFLNSLYGKFAVNGSKYKKYILTEYYDSPPEEDIGDKKIRYILDGQITNDHNLYYRNLEEHEYKFYNIVTAASITGAVRAQLWEALNKTESPYYCDTDSIMCKNKSSLKISEKLGEWDLEATGSKLFIAGKKMYALKLDKKYRKLKDGVEEKYKIASKGVRATVNELKQICNGNAVTIHNEIPTFSLRPFGDGKHYNYISRTIKMT